MELRDSVGQFPLAATPDEDLRPPPDGAGGSPGYAPNVFVFNPFAEACIARGKGFAPVKHQALMAADLANLPQFLCGLGDVVLVAERPSAAFLGTIERAGFPLPEFVELSARRIDRAGNLCRRKLGTLRPWAWGPDSIELLEPLFSHVTAQARTPAGYFNDDIARLYSKAWSAGFLRKVLARCAGRGEAIGPQGHGPEDPGPGVVESWLCAEQEAGRAAGTLEEALDAVAAIRRCGHHRVVVKDALGLAGHNAIRLWEPEVLPAQRQWLSHALRDGRQVVIEPWLERELDFSIQLEMGPRSIELCGYTGLATDAKGQYVANWADADYRRCLPASVAASLGQPAEVPGRAERLYGEILPLLEDELRRAGFVGPVSIDAFVYRAPRGERRLRPIVEINPRYTMGRLTVELMRQVCPGSCGLFRLVSRAQARAEGFAELRAYAHFLEERLGLRLEGEPAPKIRQGALCLNDPERAQVCLAIFEVSPTPHLPAGIQHPRLR